MSAKQAAQAETEQISRLQEEVDRNFQEFQKVLPGILHRESNRWALQRHRESAGFIDTLRDADTAGQALYEDGLFSLQQVMTKTADSGWFSYALQQWQS